MSARTHGLLPNCRRWGMLEFTRHNVVTCSSHIHPAIAAPYDVKLTKMCLYILSAASQSPTAN